jgi:hypothetical protein
MSHTGITSDQIAAALRAECRDKLERLEKIQWTLKTRLQQLDPKIYELLSIAKTSRDIQKNSQKVEWLESQRDENAAIIPDLPIVDSRNNLTAPPHLYQGLVDLCDALLAEKSAAV